MTNYELIQIREEVLVVKKTDKDGKEWFIPTDPANSDYQAYLKWLENPEAESTQPTL
jgi:hypothetical protein